MSVTVVIKSATQSVEDFAVECDLSWTIGRLKDTLEESYPNNPKKENQKLIYGGKLLPDHLSLKSVLNHSQERHIIHLVCPIPSKVDVSESKKAPPQSLPVPPINPAFTPLHPPSFGAMPGMAVPSLNTPDTFQQYMAMQQMYTQFMTQYLSQYNVGVPPAVPYAPVMSVPPTQSPQGPTFQQNLNANRQQRQALEEDRDYLDYFYIISRAMLLFVVLYYYSSLHRILLVVSVYIGISMYLKLNRQIQHRQEELQRMSNDAQRNQSVSSEQASADTQIADIQEPVAAENDETVSNPSSEANTQNDSLSQQIEQRSFLQVMVTTASLISAFFSSLIPSDPVPVNAN